VRRFKVPGKANHTSKLGEAYSQILCTWVGRKAGEWNDWNDAINKWMWDGSLEARSKEPEKWRQSVKQTKEEMIGGRDEF